MKGDNLLLPSQPGVSMQSRSFSRNTKEGRGDTSAWTDNPLDKAEKAKQKYDFTAMFLIINWVDCDECSL